MLAPQQTSGPMAATRVLDQDLGTVGSLLVAIGPGHHRQHDWKQVAPLVGEMVGAAGPGPLQHAVFDKLLQARTQDVRRDPETLQEFVVAGQPMKGIADDEQGPALAENFERTGQGTALARVVAPKWHGASLGLVTVNTASLRHACIRRVIQWHSCSVPRCG